MDTVLLWLQFAVLLACIFLGSRYGGVGLGLWGSFGVFVLTYVFGLAPTSPPIDVMLIILAVIMAASVMEAAGGIDYLVSVAASIIQRNPQHITVVAPLVSYAFTFGAGTGHIFYPLLPIIYETAHDNGIRPERPIAVSTIASQQAITASPVAAAMAAMIALFEPLGFGLPQIMLVSVPATLAGVIVAALVQTRIGKHLPDDPEYQARLQAGTIDPPRSQHTAAAASVPLPPCARLSALIFLAGVAFIILSGLFPGLRPHFPGSNGQLEPLSMTITIQIVMLALAAIMVWLTRPAIESIPRTKTAQAGLTAVIRASVTKGDRGLDSYLVVFDERGMVVGQAQFTKSVPLSATFAVTIPTGGPPRELTAAAPQHQWGMSLLQPLPHTLNAANDIDAGLHGLEQRGTPRAVGQRTLAGP